MDQQKDKKRRFQIVTKAALRRLLILFLVLAVLGFWASGCMMKMPGKSYQGEFKPLSDREAELQISLRRDVEKLANEIGERHVYLYDRLKEAADFIVMEFEKAGYTVDRQGYTVDGRLCENLIVEITGSQYPDEILVVGAHYDSVPECPAANDNGTGIPEEMKSQIF